VCSCQVETEFLYVISKKLVCLKGLTGGIKYDPNAPAIN
jgi:hypothetical protein